MTAALPQDPLWRGSVRRWECDENDHMNVRFHFAAAAEALEFMFRTRFGRPAPRVRRQHARFVAEARVATPLLARGGLVAATDRSLTTYVEIVGGVDGAVHSTFTCELERSADARQPALAGLAELAGLETLPAHGARRGLTTPISASALPTLAHAETLPMVEIGRGVFRDDECTQGRVATDACAGRISDGVLRLIAHLHGGDALASRQSGGIGGAVVEYELFYPRPIAPGTAFVGRSGIAALEGRIQRFAHWLFDARSGELLCASNAIAVALDLTTRKAAEFTPEQRAAIEAKCAPELVL